MPQGRPNTGSGVTAPFLPESFQTAVRPYDLALFLQIIILFLQNKNDHLGHCWFVIAQVVKHLTAEKHKYKQIVGH